MFDFGFCHLYYLSASSLGIHNQCTKVSSDSVEADRLLGLHNHCQHNDHNITTSQESEGTEGDITPTQISLQTQTLACLLGKLVATRPAMFTASLCTLLYCAEFEDLCALCTRDSSTLTRGNQLHHIAHHMLLCRVLCMAGKQSAKRKQLDSCGQQRRLIPTSTCWN